MEILTVKLQENGYLVNGTMSVPSDTSNRHYILVQEWIAQGNTPEPQFTDAELLANTKTTQKNIVKASFEAACEELVVDNGISYNGGYESAIKLDSAKRLAETLGLTTVTFFDIDNIGHNLTIAEAANVVSAIGVKYQQDFSKHQALKVQIDNATTIDEIDAIIW